MRQVVKPGERERRTAGSGGRTATPRRKPSWVAGCPTWCARPRWNWAWTSPTSTWSTCATCPDPGQLRPAQWPRRSPGTAGLDLHLLRRDQQPRPVFLQRRRRYGRRQRPPRVWTSPTSRWCGRTSTPSGSLRCDCPWATPSNKSSTAAWTACFLKENAGEEARSSLARRPGSSF